MRGALIKNPGGPHPNRFLLVALALLSACLPPLEAAAAGSAPPAVVVSGRPLHSLAAGVLQGVSEAVLLDDALETPGSSGPGPRERSVLDVADLIIWSGRELEPGLARLLQNGKFRGQVLEVLASHDLKVLPARDDDRRRDPFYWLDSRNMLILLDAIARSLIEMDPERAPVYERNWQHMAVAIGEVDRTLEFAYRDVSGVPVFFYHDTHQYFQQAYAMHVAGSAAAFGAGLEVDAERLLDVRNRMSRAGRTCLFTEKGLQEPHLDLILSGTGAKSVELDSFGVSLQPGPELYVQLMRNNFEAIAGCVGGFQAREAAGSPVDPYAPDVRRFPERITPRYLMMDQFGRSVSNKDFDGRLQLINFGYTYCPDVCPTSLAIMSQTMKLLEEDADRVQPIFITVDPERDTPEILKEYLAYFDARLLGLSASPETTKRTAELFKARYERVPADNGDPRRYTMDHTASLYLLGSKGEYLTKFAHGLPAREVAAGIRDYLAD